MDTRLEVAVIDIKQVTFGERFRVDYGDLDLLVESIKKEGIIQPLAVKRISSDQYTLLAGGRRYKACTLANITQIPVRIYPESISEMEMRAIELMENVARKDLDWVEALKLKQEINNTIYSDVWGKEEHRTRRTWLEQTRHCCPTTRKSYKCAEGHQSGRGPRAVPRPEASEE